MALSKKAKKTNISHGFEKYKDIFTNAKIHTGKKYLLNIDIKDFFDSFHFGRVKGYFIKNKYFNFPEDVASLIANLLCYNRKLPQGAPTSPVVTNLIFNIVDFKILSLAKKYRLDYTRYADDLTFSTNDKKFKDNYNSFIIDIEKLLNNEGFYINDNKTRFIYKNSRQVVTGLVVNKYANVERNYYKSTRAMAYNLYKCGEFYLDGVKGTLNQLEGRFSFIIRTYNWQGNESKAKNKIEQYKKFLFYRYFYAIQKPVLFTEGKTDFKYIKAALMNMYEEYPFLVEKNKMGEFIFKIENFHRNKRMKECFGINDNGGGHNAINVYQLYKNCQNKSKKSKMRDETLFESINKISSENPKNPFIVLLDNEPQSKGKPLEIFYNATNFRNQDSELQEKLIIQISDKANLFLSIIPKQENKVECEIEDLFEEELKKSAFPGKTFVPSSEFNKNTQFGKNDFSNYVLNNYKTINFEKFRPLLDAIQNAIKNFI